MNHITASPEARTTIFYAVVQICTPTRATLLTGCYPFPLAAGYQEAVDADWRRSRELGITGVPTFVVGNQTLVGAQPYEQLEALVMSAGS